MVGSDVAQHFLLSTAARSLSLARVARISDAEAAEVFKQVRWHATRGDPVCPHCGCLGVYAFRTRPLFKCKACEHQFSVTSGTIFAGRKLPIRDYLMAIAIFVNGAKGHPALQLSRALDVRAWRRRAASRCETVVLRGIVARQAPQGFKPRLGSQVNGLGDWILD